MHHLDPFRDARARTITRSALRCVQAVLIVFGIASLGYYVAVVLEQKRYQAQHTHLLNDRPSASRSPTPHSLLPNPENAKSALRAGEVVGRIEITRLGLAAVVRHGDDASTLKVAVAHVPGTVRPGDRGNAVLAAHRDTFFRPLRNVQRGDEIVMTTPEGKYVYRVTKTHVVSPADVWVMNNTPASVLTLVTCYPFNYVGNAPKRFIVHAAKVSEAVPALTVIGASSVDPSR